MGKQSRIGTGGGDESEHGEAAVHELGAGRDEVGAFGRGEGERLLQGEGGGLDVDGLGGDFGGIDDDGLFSRADDGGAARGAGSFGGGAGGGGAGSLSAGCWR